MRTPIHVDYIHFNHVETWESKHLYYGSYAWHFVYNGSMENPIKTWQHSESGYIIGSANCWYVSINSYS